MKYLITYFLTCTIIFAQKIDIEYFNVNNFKIPLHNDGQIAFASGVGATFDSVVVMYSSGFYLSGYEGDSLWATGYFSSNVPNDNDFSPGNVNKTTDDSLYQFYTLRSSDSEFGNSWQDWKNAVMQGAKYYDGDGNGIYNPIDLNGNGKWDKDEDKPDILGDFTTWSVFHDKLVNSYPLNRGEPLGIEIKQTIFGVKPEANPNLSNVVFVRFNISNIGLLNDRLDSVLFGIVFDPDIGEYQNDKTGCDTLRNVGYGYSNGNDDKFGDDPPALFVDILKGPHSYISNETFIDNNGSNIYDEGIDTPVDSAVTNNGSILGKSIIHGAKNISVNSIFPLHRMPPLEPPRDKYEARYFMEGGKDYQGNEIEPCESEYNFWGNAYSLPNCSELDKKNPFSGDPVTGEGWIRTHSDDVYLLISTSEFNLVKDEPVEIWVAYLVGRGTDALNSITVAREIDDYVQKYYDANFDDTQVSVLTESKTVPTEFKLFQNYPNPFNPSTTIKYQIRSNGKRETANTKLVVFDILGREVATLVNKIQRAGNYEVQFDASHLTSGIYFYKLQSGSFVATKKLLLLK